MPFDTLRYPGEVWFLPPEAREDGDYEGRRHVLLAPCPAEGGVGCFPSLVLRRRSQCSVGPPFSWTRMQADTTALASIDQRTSRHVGW